MRCCKHGISSGSTLFATHPAILDTTVGSKLYLFKIKIKYGKELRCLNTKDKYGKVTDTDKMIDYKQICYDKHFCGIYRSINRLLD